MPDTLLKRCRDIVAVAFLLLHGIPFYLYQVDSNELYSLVFNYLALPVTVGSLVLCARYLPGWGDPAERINTLLLTLLLSGSAILLSSAYVMAANAWLGEQQQVELAGEITDLRVSHGRTSTHYYVSFEDTHTGKSYTLDVGESTFTGLGPGDVYSARWTKGSLGLLYRRR